MKHVTFSTQKQEWSGDLNIAGFVRIAWLLTLGAMIVILPALVCSLDFSLWIMMGPLCVATVAFIWTVTLSIGWLVMILVVIGRITQRSVHRGCRERVEERGQVWDRWMDGPEPLVP
jgi:hypothetical protein